MGGVDQGFVVSWGGGVRGGIVFLVWVLLGEEVVEVELGGGWRRWRWWKWGEVGGIEDLVLVFMDCRFVCSRWEVLCFDDEWEIGDGGERMRW